jgi:hypothetical protein
VTQLPLFPPPAPPARQAPPPPHVGRPHARATSYGRVLVACPAGHVYLSVAAPDWPGSQMEANVRNPHYTITCHGSLGEAAR